MKTFNGFHACTVLGSILLSSLGVVCVSIERRDLGDSTQIPLNVTSLPLDTPLSTSSIDEHAALTTPLEASFNHTFTTNGVQQPRTTPIDHEVVRGGQGVNILSTTSMQQDIYLPSVKAKESDDNAPRTSTITIASSLRPDIEVNVPSATIGKATLLIPTTNEPVVSKSLEGPLFTKAADNAFEHASLSQFNTEEMLTTNPRTNIVPTGTENSTSPVLFDGHSKNTEKVAMVPSIVSPAPLTTATSVSAEQSTDVSVYLSPKDKNIKETEVTQTLSPSRGSEVSEEWDDTKLIAKNHLKFSMHENLTTSAGPDPRSIGPFFENPTDTTTETIEAKDYVGTEETPLMTVANGDILVNATDPSPKDSQAAFADGAGATLRSTNIRDEIAISTPLPDAFGHSKMKTNIYKAEVVSVVSESPHLDDTKTKAKETASKSMSTPASYASSERTLLAPSAKLESEEEGEEEREGEEEDDEDTEDDDDEDEDDEDKDVDSVDDSVEGDTELPTFTLPGLSSQEPLLEKKNQPALEEVPYRVPDTLEWEQQNQGLVRSWMEKLKDKAGYMSGMLLPVGIGIAGAFSILGALYSIKFMNRRRRLGFKRHKRKREFNSMQDRVMLLADSSEDEF